jgi:aryl-alcohol dehydrogenase-like predicted oxidoreductase
MLPFCLDQGIGVLPWSPLARGRLTRDWEQSTRRAETDQFARGLYRQAVESDRKIVEAVRDVAAQRGVPRAQVALAWLLHQPAVTAPIVGATKPEHIADAVAAVDVELSEQELTRLGEHYVPHAPEGY